MFNGDISGRGLDKLGVGHRQVRASKYRGGRLWEELNWMLIYPRAIHVGNMRICHPLIHREIYIYMRRDVGVVNRDCGHLQHGLRTLHNAI